MKRVFFLITAFFLVSAGLLSADVMLTMISGNVQVKQSGSEKFAAVKANTLLKSGDSVQVGEKSKLVVKFSDGSTYIVSTPRTFKVGDLESQKAANSGKNINQLLRLKAAKLVNKNQQGSDVTAVAGVRGADVDNQKKKADPDRVSWK